MDYEYVESVNFKSTKIRLVSDKNGRLFVRKNVRVDRLLAEKLKGISSPYIVKFIEFGEDNDGAYVIEEYVEGVTAAERSFTKKQAVKILIELCDALDALHSAKIVHRDIKPSNIIITKDEHIKLIDFDASRIEKVVKDRDTQILGTEGFAPPEQFGFSQTDSRSDIYSFGVTMNLLLGENSMPFNKIIKKCKALDPDDRYDSISAVKTAIRLAVLKRFAAIPMAALLLIVFTTVFSAVLNNRDFTDHTSAPYSESYISSVSDTTQPLPIDSQPESGKDSTDSTDSSSGGIDSDSLSTSSESPSEPETSKPPESSPPTQSSESSKPPEIPQSTQNSEPPQTSEPSGITQFFTTITNSSGDYEDVCNYTFNDDSLVHGTWNAVGTLEKDRLKSFTRGRTDLLNRTIDNMLIQNVTLSADGSADVNNGAGAKWTKDYFILRYNNAQYVQGLIYAKVNGTEYLLIENKTDGYAKTGTTKNYFVFMNANSRKIRYTTVINDKGNYEDICDLVFYDDPAVYGTWEMVGYLNKDYYGEWLWGAIDAFSGNGYWLREITFLSSGIARTQYGNFEYYDNIWTNGYFIPSEDMSFHICEYFIVTRKGTDYLLFENKVGDYTRYGISDTYSILTRKND
ncbi:MAG: serine/threonine protein kinase [Ruminococcaceae bacterium]|nr:serine/threonine protein kinase [Oscillospiraceae bacterium]